MFGANKKSLCAPLKNIYAKNKFKKILTRSFAFK
jgi:hypothetical protein